MRRISKVAALFAAAAILIGAAFTAVLGNAWGLFATLAIAALLALFLISTLVSYFVLPRGDSDKRKEMLDDQRD
ncbi:hypothetical protein [Lacipirellula sp.]|uniref:hypothetical protein n=1 Tax=Lacipirellula sp. TaxID=2691419 RepID=UPI003D0B8317